MTETPKAPATKPEHSAFERMKEFTRRLIAVPKEEVQREDEKRKGHRPSPA